MKYHIISIVLLFAFSCRHSDVAKISIDFEVNTNYRIEIRNIITNELISTLTDSIDIVYIDINNPKIAKAYSDSFESELFILKPGGSHRLNINKENLIIGSSVEDSIINYLSNSTNEFISANSNTIFSDKNPNDVIDLFSEFRTERFNKIKDYNLNSQTEQLLQVQNESRITSFLFYYGRIIKRLSPNNKFFDFIDDIDHNQKLHKLLPQNLLYKHEIQYLRTHSSINNIKDFMNYIQTNTSNKDLASFLNILYLKELIISPSYWLNHDSIFNSKVLEQALKDEVNNPYYGIIDETANSYFAAQAGQSAYNFTIEDMNGEIKILSDFTGKLLYIDNWATWCGPCINERKNVQELAANFKNNPMVEILMISTDRQKEKWIDFLKDDPEFNNIDYHIIEAELEDYIDAFNVSFLPKYILINENGKIIDANASQPSLGLKQYIEDYIKQM